MHWCADAMLLRCCRVAGFGLPWRKAEIMSEHFSCHAVRGDHWDGLDVIGSD